MNVLLEQDGMGILVPHLINAQMEKNGIFSLLHVNVLLVQSGMELSASSQLFAVEANSLTPTTSASVSGRSKETDARSKEMCIY